MQSVLPAADEASHMEAHVAETPQSQEDIAPAETQEPLREKEKAKESHSGLMVNMHGLAGSR